MLAGARFVSSNKVMAEEKIFAASSVVFTLDIRVIVLQIQCLCSFVRVILSDNAYYP